MTQRIYNTIAKCYTCEFWSGKRTTDYARTHVEVSDPNEIAQCFDPKRPSVQRVIQPWIGGCTGFQKWTPIKQPQDQQIPSGGITLRDILHFFFGI